MSHAPPKTEFFQRDVKTVELDYKGERRRITVETRKDPLFGVRSLISPERAGRSLSFYPEMSVTEKEDCVFCRPYEDTPEPRYEHRRNGNVIALSFPNLHPSAEHHLVTVYAPFGVHKSKPTEITYADLEALVESEFDLVGMYRNGAAAFEDYTNLGALAAASQKHLHSQRKATSYIDDVQKRELENAKQLYERYGKNPFDLLVELELDAGERVIHNDDVYVGASFSPRTTHEILVIPRFDASSILMTDGAMRQRMARPSLGVLHGLRLIYGIKDMNIVVHQAPYEDAPWFRWHMHIYPRRLKQPPVDQGGEELGYETYPVEGVPEQTAKCLRPWYQQGASEQLLLRVGGETPDQLAQEFAAACNGQR